MAQSNAERQRRYRERKRAEQQKAANSSAPPVTGPVTCNDVTGEAPELGRRGLRLWSELTDGADLRPAERVLAEEACRLADRLDVLDRILRGDEDAWLRLRGANEDGSVVKVVVNAVLAEARQQQIALKQLLGELRQHRSAGAPSKPAAGQGAKEAGDVPAGAPGPGVVSLAARLAAKRSGQATG